MAQGIKALRKIQYGFETSGSEGTQVAATHILRMTGTLQDMRETVFPEEDVGYLPGVDRNYCPKLGAELVVEGPATFEQLPVILNCAVAMEANSTDAGGYIHTFTFATTATTTHHTLTIECGDNEDMEYTTYAFVPEFTLSGAAGEAWNISATFRGRDVSTTDLYTSDLTLPVVQEILFSKTKLYVDDTTDTIGTTVIANTLLAADLKFTTGWQEVFAADGEKYFSFTKQVMPDIVFDLTFEHNDNALAEKANWRAGTPRQIQLWAAGSDGSRDMYIRAAGAWESWDKIGEQDGNDIVRGTFRVRYNADASRFCAIAVHNNNATST